MSIRSTRVAAAFSVLLALLVTGTGCVSVPKLKPDYVGLGDLPLMTGHDAISPYEEATTLPMSSPEARSAPYRLGPPDEIVVAVWGRDDLGSQVPVGVSGELRASGVRDDGTVALPFLGEVQVAGKTLQEARDAIQSRYARLVENPQVEVDLHACASQAVEVSGAVLRPGRYHLCDDMRTLGDVMNAARGTADDADLSRGVLNRDGYPFHLDFSGLGVDPADPTEILMQHGDRIHFPFLGERVVYVFGEVGRQGAYPIPLEGLTLVGALARARGLDTVSAKHKGIFLMRERESGVVVYKLSMAELLQGPAIPAADQDRIFIGLNGLERWDMWWRKALPFTTVRTDVQIGSDE